MKKILIVACLYATIAQSAIVKVQNSSNESVQVTLYNDKGEIIRSWIVDTNKPQTLNSGLQSISRITWVQTKLLNEKTESLTTLSRSSHEESTYTLPLTISAVALKPKLIILKNGNYKYLPKKNELTQGTARRVSQISKENKDDLSTLQNSNN